MRRAWAAVAAVLLVGVVFAPSIGAKAPNRAGVVVRAGDGDVQTMCVAFETESITGAELLERTGLDLAVDHGPIGAAMCKIGRDGCDSGDCFCRYPTFWGYWTSDEKGDWEFSDVGASDREVRDGTLDGWSFGRNGEPAPPDVSFDDVCSGEAATATLTPANVTHRAAAEPARAERPSSSPRGYGAFAALAGFFALSGGVLYAARRRRMK